MVTYTLNETQRDNKILLTDVPNILKLKDDVDIDSAQKAYLYFTVSGATSLPVTGDGQYTIMVEGETISNVTDPVNAINKNFYISRASNGDYATAASIARAFRNCPTIAANWTIEQDERYVMLKEKTPIETDTQSYYSDIISPSWNGKLTLAASDAQDITSLAAAKVMVDIYKGENSEYITTLEKTCNLNEVAFNISPVLSTFAEYGKAVPFRFTISYLTKNAAYYKAHSFDDDLDYITIGYMVNQGQKYLNNDYLTIAQNVNRGKSWGGITESGVIINHTLLYLYEPQIPVSFYRGNNDSLTVKIDYLDSAFNRIGSATTTWESTDSREVLVDTGYTINLGIEYDEYWENAFYVDLCIGTQVLRYNVIKPLFATEGNQRICWRNSYGGISFFDFTGKKSETRSLDLQTYKKNIYDYYPTDEEMVIDSDNPWKGTLINELEKVYNNDVDYQVTLKSHLFEEDGKYIFNDIMQSSRIWTEVNGQKYAIILDSVSVDEVDTNNNIYEATIKFHYSQKPSLI